MSLSDYSSVHKFSTKKFRIPQEAKVTFTESLIRDEKKKPGPSTYKLTAKGKELAFENNQGINKGIPLSGTDQMQMITHIRTKAKESPQVGHYKIDNVSHFSS